MLSRKASLDYTRSLEGDPLNCQWCPQCPRRHRGRGRHSDSGDPDDDDCPGFESVCAMPGPVLSSISHGLSLPCPSPGKDAYCHPSCVPLSALGPETAGPGGPKSCQTLQGPSSLQAQAQACTVQPERRGWGGTVISLSISLWRQVLHPARPQLEAHAYYNHDLAMWSEGSLAPPVSC